MTFVLHWMRDGGIPGQAVVDALTDGIARLRDDPIAHWVDGPLRVTYFAGDPTVSIARHRTGVAMVFGRLDAADDLVRKVGDPHAHGSDAELLAAAYERWGERCFEHLLGDYVAVVWDAVDRRLSCVRDVVGVAPCYYWADPTEAVVAGHLGGAVSHPKVRRLPNEGYVAEVLSSAPVSREDSLYRDVSRLVAGYALTVDSARTAGRRVQSIEPWPIAGRQLSPEEWDELYLDVLTVAIRDRMRGVDRVGSNVSGGLDSSSIAVLAAELEMTATGRPLQTYSLAFPGFPECDESEFIAAVVDRESIDATVLTCPPLGEDRLSHEVTATLDVPSPPNGAPWVYLSGVAKAHGVSRMLNGVGGDQWFTPSMLYPLDLARAGHGIQAAKAAIELAPQQSPVGALLRYLARPAAGRAIRRVWPQWRPSSEVPSWVAPSLYARTGLHERLTSGRTRARSAHDARSQYVRDGWEAHYHEASALAGSRAGIPDVSPYYDARLIGFALAMDESQRLQGGWPRAIQRRAMRGRLPESVRLRTSKADFGHLFVEQFGLGPQSSKLTRLDAVLDRGWVNPAEIDRRRLELEEDARAGRDPRHIWPLWSVLGVNSWAAVLE